MRSNQRKCGFGMVETRQFLPGFRRMTGFATCRRSVCSNLPHAIFELTLVRIGVTGRAGAILETVGRRVFGLRRRSFLVAVTTGNRDVSSGQHKPALLVLRQGEGGRPVSI